ncbi:MAG: hypothetical protein HYR51_10160 [Candidatus Rokubacteria bacterium]|nr:hypothetical protein [Candidatus Rokubacteria bacterium]
MIPDRVVEVVSGPAVIQVATRDAALRPAHTLAVGAFVHDDRATVTVYVAELRAAQTLANLADNGRIAVACGLVSHEAYQLKGACLESRPTTDDDVRRQEAYRAAILAAMRRAYPDAIAVPLTQGMPYRPGVAITFRVESVFLQTPGPGAGARMV